MKFKIKKEDAFFVLSNYYVHLMIVTENLVINLELNIQILFEIRKFLFIRVPVFIFVKILYNFLSNNI
jgi:hypothetical protein